VSQRCTRSFALVAFGAAVAFALRAGAVPAWRRYAEHQARDAELHAG
jgi:hypothetical protein